MQTANALLALGGKRGETVPKYGITPAEIAVLQFLHGADAVYEIDIQAEEVKRTHRQEIERLRENYHRREGEKLISVAVDALFPGVGAQVPQNFDELELPTELFIVAERRTTLAAPEEVKKAAEKSIDKMTANELRTYAETAGIDVTGLDRKADLLDAIKLAESDKPSGNLFDGE